MKVLFDHNVPHKLRKELDMHHVETAEDMGWAELQNGALLNEAELHGFDVLITADKNLSYQQNLSGRRFALIVLSTNNWNLLRANTLEVVEAIERVKPGSFETVSI